MDARAPRLVMLAGPNGSGKSALINALRADVRFGLPALYINADDLQRERGISDARQAQQLAKQLRAQALIARQDVMYETVMSHPSKLAELQQAKSAGFDITVIVVATDTPDVNVERVALRVAAGGHDVPEDRIRQRYERTLALAPIALGYAKQAAVFDNTRGGDTGEGLSEQATLAGNRLVMTAATAAPWVQRLVAQVNERAGELNALAKAVESNGLPPQLARLHDSQTSGPMIVLTEHYALQYNEQTRSAILHDRTLLGALGKQLVLRQAITIRYDEGVARTLSPERDRRNEGRGRDY